MLLGNDFIRVIQGLGNPLHDHLLQAGKLYPWRPLPSSVAQMEAKACWGNACRLARETGWDYACGYACANTDMPVPIMHAWVVDPDGSVVDPTWAGVQRGSLMDVDYSGMVDRRYFGIVLPLEQVEGYASQDTVLTLLEQHLRAQLHSLRMTA